MSHGSTLRSTTPLLAAWLAVSCTGSIGADPTGDRADDPAPAAAPAPAPASVAQPDRVESLGCDQSLRGTTELPVRRLTKRELVNTLTALFGAAVMSDPAVQGSLPKIPDQTSVSNTEFDNAITDVEGLEAVATEIAGVVFRTPAAAGQALAGCDGTDAVKCTDALVGGFATRAFRRPPTAQTQQSVRALVAKIGGVEGLKHGLVRVLTSPYFHQHIELGETPDAAVSPGAPRLRLSQYEVASRLAFQLTGAPPDEALLNAAAAGTLSNVDAIRTHARRLVASAAARESWRRVVGDWLGLAQVPDPNPAVIKELGVSEAGLGREAQEEMLRYAAYVGFDRGGTLRDLFTQRVAFPYTTRLAKVLGVAQSTAAQPVTGGLGGLLLRPAVLMSGTTVTSPILRSVFVHRKVLCTTLPDPDPNAVDARVMETKDLSHKDLSNRAYFTALTGAPGCVACHGTINPLGFTMEGFGPLGAPRQVEVLYDAKGPTSITHPIDTAVDDIHIDGERRPAAGAAEAMTLVASSPKAKACLDGALIVNTRYRALDATDACLMKELAAIQDSGGSLVDALVASVANEGIFWRSSKGVQ